MPPAVSARRTTVVAAAITRATAIRMTATSIAASIAAASVILDLPVAAMAPISVVIPCLGGAPDHESGNSAEGGLRKHVSHESLQSR